MIGYYIDIDGTNVKLVDETNLPKFIMPKKKINLLNTYDRKKTIAYVNEFHTSIIPLLKYLQKIRYRILANTVITYRGILKDISQTPFTKYPKDEVCKATIDSGCIILEKDDEEPKLFDNVLRGTHYNNEFKKQCVQNYCGDLYRVHEIIIGRQRFIVASVVDAVDDSGLPIKIKVAPLSEYGKDVPKLTFQRLLDLWTQCHFGQVETVVIAFYDPSGVVNKVKKYKMDELRNQLINQHKIDPNQCLRSLDWFANVATDAIIDEDSEYTIGQKNGKIIIRES